MEKHQQSRIIEKLFAVVPEVREFLLPDSELYLLLDTLIKDYYQNRKKEGLVNLGPVKNLNWPCIPLGNLDSYDLFSLAKFMHFIYLGNNFGHYKTIFDVGGNIGLDSIVFEKFGYKVFAFEPDPLMVEQFEKLIELNNCKNITIIKKALSSKKQQNDFVRVKGNLTASHINGARDYYGDVDLFQVESITFNDLDVIPDIMKINIEGFEKDLIPSIPARMLETCDFIISIHTVESRDIIYDFLKEHEVNIFTQKTGWNQAESKNDLPGFNKEGYIFASKNDVMRW